MPDDLAAQLAEWGEDFEEELNRAVAEEDDSLKRSLSLLAAVEAALKLADDLTRKSEALDAEAEYIAGEHPEAAAVAVLKRERSIAYDECARWFREAITAALAGKEADR